MFLEVGLTDCYRDRYVAIVRMCASFRDSLEARPPWCSPPSLSLLCLSLLPSSYKALGLLPSPSGLLRVPGLFFSSLPFGHISANQTINLVYNTSVQSLCEPLHTVTTQCHIEGYTHHKVTSQQGTPRQNEGSDRKMPRVQASVRLLITSKALPSRSLQKSAALPLLDMV